MQGEKNICFCLLLSLVQKYSADVLCTRMSILFIPNCIVHQYLYAFVSYGNLSLFILDAMRFSNFVHTVFCLCVLCICMDISCFHWDETCFSNTKLFSYVNVYHTQELLAFTVIFRFLTVNEPFYLYYKHISELPFKLNSVQSLHVNTCFIIKIK